jgi:glycosyltransferase involved in cell wall biosynthesis
MRILFVARPDSIHTARWISQIEDQAWDIFLFPVYIARWNSTLRNITVFESFTPGRKVKKNHVRSIWWIIPFFLADFVVSRIKGVKTNYFTTRALAIIIRWLQPDVVHSLEMQHAGYMTLDAKNILLKKFPVWIATNWGSDIYLFKRLAEHRPKIESVLANCDYYSCECQRDVILAKNLGFMGIVLPVLPNAGGIELSKVSMLKSTAPPASRRMIILKGYQNWAGRALVGLEAMRYCAELLHDYTLTIYMASPEILIAAELFSQDTKIPVQIISSVSHDEMLGLYSHSRIYIGLSISDGISTSLLEAMAMGTFPIQSCTACADEWIVNGQSGLIVPPEDPQAIAEALRQALTDDSLVNRAAEMNAQTIAQRLDNSVIKPQVIRMYQDIYAAREE